jgi:hypothetical protein
LLAFLLGRQESCFSHEVLSLIYGLLVELKVVNEVFLLLDGFDGLFVEERVKEGSRCGLEREDG